MEAHRPTPPLEDLLAHADWVRGLAGRLVTDAARADDVAQDTWVAALESPPRDARNLKSWLASIVRNTARGRGREERRRTERERAVSRPESDVPSSEELVQRANLQREIAGHVVALDEPYRTVVLLRWYEGLLPREIAERLGRPVDTVTTQLARAHARLREKLDKEHGDRSTWSALLAALARPDAAARVGTGAGLIGGVVVGTGWKIGIGAVVVALACLALWRTEPSSGPLGPAAAARDADLGVAPIDEDVRGLGGAEGARPERAPVGGSTPERQVARPTEGLVGLTVHGRVVDERGDPIPGLRLRGLDNRLARREKDTVFDKHGNVVVTPAELAGFRARPDTVDAFVATHAEAGMREAILGIDLGAETVTDSAGRYSFAVRGTKDGWVDLESADPAWVLFTSGYERPSHGVVQIAAPAITMAGEIVDADGRPIEGADVSIYVFMQNLRELALDLDSRSMSTLSAESVGPGRFRFERAPRVKGWSVQAWCRGWRSTCVPIPDSSDEHMRIVMRRDRPSPTLQGVVLDRRGEPAADATVVFGDASVKTDVRGTFHLAPRTWREDSDLVAAKTGSIAAIVAGFGSRIRADENAVDGLVLRLGEDPLAISGRVISAKGDPCVGWNVDLYDGTAAGGSIRSVEALTAGITGADPSLLTDSKGAFRIEGLSSRPYCVRALSPDARVMVMREACMPGAGEAVLKVPSDALRPRISGRVISHGGEPVAGAKVSIRGRTAANKAGWTEGINVFPVMTDERGRFEMLDVPRYHVTLHVTQGFLVSKSITLAADEAGENLEIVVERRVRVHLELIDADPADAFEVLDETGEKLTIVVHDSFDVLRSTRVERDHAGFPMCEVSELGKTLVLVQGDTELRRVPIALATDKTNVIRP